MAVLSGVTGAAATVVALAAVGSLSPRTVERVERTGTSSVVTPTTGTATAVAASIAPSVVTVTATVGEARRRGSGVVMSAEGLILTSESLVSGAETVEVTWPSGATATATGVGHDDMTGLAALEVDGTDHPVADLEIADPVPGATAITVAGPSRSGGPAIARSVVSAANVHADPDGGRLLGLIQTDQPVPGWADGGALVDVHGSLIGVCLVVPGREATGFAVPAAVAQRVAEDLGRTGSVERGWLGVRGTAVDADDPTPEGVRIDEVAPGSPAAAADLRAGDILTAVDGQPVRSLADVQSALVLSRPDDEVTIDRVRSASAGTVEVTLGETPD